MAQHSALSAGLQVMVMQCWHLPSVGPDPKSIKQPKRFTSSSGTRWHTGFITTCSISGHHLTSHWLSACGDTTRGRKEQYREKGIKAAQSGGVEVHMITQHVWKDGTAASLLSSWGATPPDTTASTLISPTRGWSAEFFCPAEYPRCLWNAVEPQRCDSVKKTPPVNN